MMSFSGIQTVLISLTALNLAMFGLSVIFVFRAGTPDRRLSLLKSAAAAAAAADLYSLWSTPQVSEILGACATLGLVASTLLFGWAAKTIRNDPFTVVFSTDAPIRLVDFGPYRYIRHPFYTAYLLTYLCVTAATAQPLAAAAFCWMLGLYVHAAVYEEQKFSGAQNLNYAAYKRKTGMFFPQLRMH